MAKMQLGYVNFFVSNFERAFKFYKDQLGLEVLTNDAEFGYASFDTGAVQIAFAKANDQPELIGRHTGIGLVVEDLEAVYEELRAAGVEFEMPPEKQPWGGFMAMFKDPDGNVFYLDQVIDHE